jgi:hypothetical protein
MIDGSIEEIQDKYAYFLQHIWGMPFVRNRQEMGYQLTALRGWRLLEKGKIERGKKDLIWKKIFIFKLNPIILLDLNFYFLIYFILSEKLQVPY